MTKLSKQDKLKAKLSTELDRKKQDRLIAKLSERIDNVSDNVSGAIGELNNKVVDLTKSVDKQNKKSIDLIEKQNDVESKRLKTSNDIAKNIRDNISVTKDGNKAIYSLSETELARLKQDKEQTILLQDARKQLESNLGIGEKISNDISNIDSTLTNVWNPEEKALNVLVKNQTGSGSRFSSQFRDSNNKVTSVKLDSSGNVPVNASGVTLYAVVNTSAGDGSSVYQATNPWIVGGTVSIAGGSLNVKGDFSADVTGSSVYSTIVNTPSVDASGTTIFAVVNTASAGQTDAVLGGSVTVYQGTNPWIVDASGQTLYAVVNTEGTVSVDNFPSEFGNNGGSVTAYQGGAWDVNVTGGSIHVEATAEIEGASIYSTIVNTPSVDINSGSIDNTAFANSGGSVTVYQGGDPWNVDASGQTLFAVVNTEPTVSVDNFPTEFGNNGGSVTAYQGTDPWSVDASGNTLYAIVNTDNTVAGGSITAYQGTDPWTVDGTVTANISGGSVTVYQGEEFDVNVTGGSIHVEATAEIEGASVIATIVNTPDVNIASGSIDNTGFANNGGSVTAYQGTDPWITDASGSTLFAVVNTDNTVAGGSVTAYQGTDPWNVDASGVTLFAVVNTESSVSVNGGSITSYQGGDWDINDISAGTQTNDVKITLDGESIDVTGSSIRATISGSVDNTEFGVNGGSITAYQGTNPWTVDATNLDIRDLTSASDSVDVTGSSIISTVQNDGFGASVSNWEGASGLDVTANIKDSGITQVYYELSGAAGTTTVYSNATGFIVTDFWMSSDVAQKIRMTLDGVTMPAFSFAANGGMVSNNTTPLTGASILDVTTGSSGVFSITVFGYNK